MSHDTFKEYQPESNSRLLHLKHLTDHLISLAPFAEEPTIEDKAHAIVEEMKSISSAGPVVQLSQLERLAELSAQHPEEPQLTAVIDDTADYLLDEIQDFNPDELKNMENLSSVWATIKAWDIARSPKTGELCVTILNNYRGQGQAHLAEAFILAKREELPFENALERVNGEAA